MIVVGYQGIGKSTLAGKQDCIDLESSNFWVKDVRPDNWARIYCNIAEHLSAQGYTVFTSSHSAVRDIFSEDIISGRSHEKIYCIFPSPELKSHWIVKLKRRYDKSKSDKDRKAYLNALDRYEDNIRELSEWSYAEPVMLTDMTYSLSTIIDRLQIANHDNAHVSNIVNERWLPVSGYEGRYEVSNLGRIRSIPINKKITRSGKEEVWCVKGKVLKPITTGPCASPSVHLFDENKVRKNYLVKNLVAQAFLGFTGPTYKVKYKDGNKDNCRLDNLYIVGKEE